MKKFAFFLVPLMAISFLTNCGPKQYTVTFDPNGGTPVASQTVEENKCVVKPDNPIKNGYTFGKWCTDEALTTEYDFSNLVTSNFTLYAKYSPVDYTINYHMPDGASKGSNPISYTIENEDITLTNATIDKKGYECNGWHVGSATGEQITTIHKGSTGNLELYTSETAITYTITYHMPDGATHTNPTSYTIETNDITLTNPTGEGYTFNGWRLGSASGELITKIPKGSTGNLELYTSTTAITYKITYKNISKAEHSTDPETYTVEDEINLSTPTRDSWTFGGWYTEPEFKNKVTNIPKGSYGDKTLYAKMIYCKNLENCSWEEIRMVSEKDGGRATFGNPGEQTKQVTLGGVENQVRILAYDYDELSTSTEANPQYARITFEFTNTFNSVLICWNDKQGLKSTNYDFINNSNLNERLQPSSGDIYYSMPSSLTDVIKIVNKKVDIHLNNEWIKGNYSTRLFPLSYDEINGSSDAYEYYKVDSQNRRIKNNKVYWLRSPYTSSDSGAHFVIEDGGLDHTAIFNQAAISFAFCI